MLAARPLSLPVLALVALTARAQTPLHTFTGPAQNASLGFSLLNCGDVDGDGIDDLAAGQTSYANPSVRVWSGASGALLHDFVYSANVGLYYGSTVASAGDVDGDGRPDILIGAPGFSTQSVPQPFVEVRSGATGALLRTLQGPAGSRFGATLAAIGDWNGDGRREFVVGAPDADFNATNTGRVYVFDGDPAFAAPLFTLDGPTSTDYYGHSVADAGDVDGDGVPDFLVGGINTSVGQFQRIGRVDVRKGPSGALLRSLHGPLESTCGFGVALANVGDTNGDGRPDMAVGTYLFGSNDRGRVQLYSGLDGSLLVERFGSKSNERLGYLVKALGDLDGDGAGDLLAAGGDDSPALVLSGSSGELLFTLAGGPTGYMGHGAIELGDLDGDGRHEFAVSDPGYLQSRGRVRVFRGLEGSTYTYCTAGVTSDGCTPTLTATGVPSASAATPFQVTASGLAGQKSGLFFYGLSGAQAQVWGPVSLWLCVKAPLQRTRFTSPGGTIGLCDAQLTLDWNTYVQTTPSALGQPFQPGNRIWMQGWFRDPASQNTTSLTGALSFQLTP